MTATCGKSKVGSWKVKPEELEAIVEQAKVGPLSDEQPRILNGAIGMLIKTLSLLQSARASIASLKHLFFGKRTEKMSTVLGNGSMDGAENPETEEGATTEEKPEEKRKGHGRIGLAAYTAAKKVQIPHSSLKHKDACSDCDKGIVYRMPFSWLLRIIAATPFQATAYGLEGLRCGLCGKVFRAKPPAGIGEEKYDETVMAMLAKFRYELAMPLYRMAKMMMSLGIPMPSSTQWDLLAAAADRLTPLFQALQYAAAQGYLLHNDDTDAKILDLKARLDKEVEERERMEREEAELAKQQGRKRKRKRKKKDPKIRTGIFTTAIASFLESRVIALFLTGLKHAGENLAGVLSNRSSELPPPMQMCDASSRNVKGLMTLLANCTAHARRKFVEAISSFPEECKHVLEVLANVYHHDHIAKEKEMSHEERLRFHQAKSSPLMEELKGWLEEQINEKKVEPSSSVGKAITYMLNHWDKLTLFLRVPGAPMDNNINERILKLAILYRKNSLFFKTENGARVADLFMSLIHTANLNGVNSYDYLVTVLRHHKEMAKDPSVWLPWNYQETLARLSGDGPSQDAQEASQKPCGSPQETQDESQNAQSPSQEQETQAPSQKTYTTSQEQETQAPSQEQEPHSLSQEPQGKAQDEPQETRGPSQGARASPLKSLDPPQRARASPLA